MGTADALQIPEVQNEASWEKIKIVLRGLVDKAVAENGSFDGGVGYELTQGLPDKLSEATGQKVTFACSVNDNGREKFQVVFEGVDGKSVTKEMDV